MRRNSNQHYSPCVRKTSACSLPSNIAARDHSAGYLSPPQLLRISSASPHRYWLRIPVPRSDFFIRPRCAATEVARLHTTLICTPASCLRSDFTAEVKRTFASRAGDHSRLQLVPSIRQICWKVVPACCHPRIHSRTRLKSRLQQKVVVWLCAFPKTRANLTGRIDLLR